MGYAPFLLFVLLLQGLVPFCLQYGKYTSWLLKIKDILLIAFSWAW